MPIGANDESGSRKSVNACNQKAPPTFGGTTAVRIASLKSNMATLSLNSRRFIVLIGWLTSANTPFH